MNRSLRRLAHNPALLIASLHTLGLLACGSEVIIIEGGGGSSSGGNSSVGGGSSSGGNSSVGGGSSSGGSSSVGGGSSSGGSSAGGGNSVGGGGSGGSGGGSGGSGGGSGGSGGSAIDCVTAESGDPCTSPGSYCSYFDSGSGEQCDSWCSEFYKWDKNCYEQPTYCSDPKLCPGSIPQNGSKCSPTPNCDYYDCQYAGVCGGAGTAYASCGDGYWSVSKDCYCYEPPDLCPATPPENGSPCKATAQCEHYECYYTPCGPGSYAWGYCNGGVWQTQTSCN